MKKYDKWKVAQLKEYIAGQSLFQHNKLYYMTPLSVNELVKKLSLNKSIIQTTLSKINVETKVIDENKPLDEETMQHLLLELNIDFVKMHFDNFYEQLQFFGFSHSVAHFAERSLIVTVMGHVDHGKTSLLDVIRNSQLTQKEHGKITQKIGGYEIVFQKKMITFIDTPGHELFTSMRVQGAQITDLIILVVAANEGVKVQTVEAINHAKATKVPIVVFINKVDLADADPEKVMKQLTKYDLAPTLWGGKTTYITGSCLTKSGIQKLLQALLQISKSFNLQTDLNLLPKAVVIDSWLDKKGIKTSLIVEQGVLKIRDGVIIDGVVGKVKAIYDDRKNDLNKATPGECVVVLGLQKVVTTGSRMFVFPSDKLIQNLAKDFHYQKKISNVMVNDSSALEWETFLQTPKIVHSKINLIIKLDSKATERVFHHHLANLQNITNDKDNANMRQLHFIFIGVGEITLNDINLAKSTNSIIVAFDQKISNTLIKKLQTEGVKHRNFYLFYELLEYLVFLKSGKTEKAPKEENILGDARILKIFQHSKFGTIAGCVVTSGTIKLSDDKFKVVRNNEVIGTNLKIKSLRQEKNIIQSAQPNQEVGIIFFNFINLKIDDKLIQYQLISEN